MGQGIGAILATSQKTEPGAVPPFPPGSADNGLSVDGVSGHIVLGNERGDVLQPALILDDREIPFGSGGFSIFLTNDALQQLQVSPVFLQFTNAAGDFAVLASSQLAIADGLGTKSCSFLPGEMQLTNSVGNPFIDMQAMVAGGEFLIDLDTAGLPTMRILNQGGSHNLYYELINGRFGIGVMVPTARLHLPAGLATPGNAPFKYTPGPLAQTIVEDNTKNFDGTNESLAVGGTTYIMAKTLTATAVLDFPNTLTLASSDLTIAVPGAVLGDVVLLGVPNGSANANSCYTAFVSAADTVTVRFNNYSALAIDPASGTFRVSVVRY